MSKIVPLRLVEEDDEDTDLGKEVGDTYPSFQFQRFGSANGAHIYLIHAADEFIGSLNLRHDPISGQEKWSISFIESQKRHTDVPVASKEEGAQLLWQDRMGIVQLPNNPPYYEPLGEVPDDPKHYENVQAKVKKLVSFLAEESEEDDDFDDSKDLNFDQGDVTYCALKSAGFNVRYAENKNGYLHLEFSWPAPNAVTYVNGWRRAREIMAPYMQMRQANFKVFKEGTGNDRIAVAYVIKRLESDPNLWKVVEHGNGPTNGAAAWHDILFNGKNVGQVYLEVFSGLSDYAEHLREEFSELNEIVPFDPNAWSPGGNAWARGPVIQWWRANRNKIPNASAYAFDKSLLGEQ